MCPLEFLPGSIHQDDEPFVANSNHKAIESLFLDLDKDKSGYIKKRQVSNYLRQKGFSREDQRFTEVFHFLDNPQTSPEIDLKQFTKIVEGNFTFKKAVNGNLIIPNFTSFIKDLKSIFQDSRSNVSGQVAEYIPQLKRVDPDQFGLSICSIDGQRFGCGDNEVPLCIQSLCKPINYCMVLEDLGDEVVHRYVGHEPSGKSYNELTLTDHGIPHNPMVNAGGIMCCSLLQPKLSESDRFDHVINMWKKLSGGSWVGFNNAVYLSERKSADRNFALGYFMREKNAFPPDTELIRVLEFYFQCCSIQTTVNSLSIVAATLANRGVCPITCDKILDAHTVKNCLSLMSSCGMYNYSGEFAFRIGLPAKSGVSGAIMIVIPNIMGICVWSPRLDHNGNSVRGLEFCKRLVQLYNFHNYDTMIIGSSSMTDVNSE